ncbi:MAG: cation diffusion facilitator family transporter [Thiohalomonadales bacterium]|nr:cation diffusion facilitator family transporter [Thiohalomonadales bacterium]
MKVTLIGSVIDLLLGVFKILFGVLSQSQALIADGIHSLSDLATDVIVIYAAKHAHTEADEEHPYGHGRFETVATVGLGLALLAVAVGIGIDATLRLFHPDKLLIPGVAALVVAAISIVSKEAIYHYTMRVARKYKSNMLRANAWHSRSDAISSVVVLVGVAGSMAGLDYLDAIAAIGVALMIAKIGWDLAWHSIRELVDTALEAERVEAIRQTILEVEGVVSLHVLRTRRMAGEALVDVHIQVAPHISVSEGHYVSETVRARVIKEIEEVADVMVHIDPENDEVTPPNTRLPLRHTLMARLEQQWQDVAAACRIQDVTLHYLESHIQVELKLPLALLGEEPQARRESLQAEFNKVAARLDEVSAITLSFV